MSKPLRLGLAGLGTVGTGLVKIVQEHADVLAARAGRMIEIAAVCARDPSKNRGVDLSGYDWVDAPLELARREDVDVVVEMIGGSEGAARDLVTAALEAGKHVVTANKALLAHHGYELALLAERHGVGLCYEAAVAGGIPIIKSLREGFAGNRIDGVYGILNGTCNYMLTAMRETGRDFDVILKEAQDLGYAEVDPTFDIDGIDAAHKLCLLSALAFGTQPDFDSLEITGIRGITATDIKFAGEFGYRIKLLGIARRIDGQVMQVMEPCMVPEDSALGGVEDAYNAVYVDGDSVETALLTGKGAGAGPTASAVMSDIMDLARGTVLPVFGIPADKLAPPCWMSLNDVVGGYYLRLDVLDQPGVLADVSAILRDERISIESMVQHGRNPGQPVSIVMILHDTAHAAIVGACQKMESLPAVLAKPCFIPIEEL
ncbi:MAG: homoserine dehydrogenase [Alphaproteobacteria bacterium]|nr:homoserine dehydrogenase [Alphaproteobacteria bacterium]